MPFQQIIMHALQWHRCAPPILLWLWPPYYLLPRSCWTWIFFIDPHWWVPLCVQRPAIAMPYQQIIMYALHYQHDVDVHLLFSFALDLHITCSWGHIKLGFSSSILTDGYNFACSAQQKLYLFNKLHVLQCQHDIDVHLLFCFDLDLLITCSWGRV